MLNFKTIKIMKLKIHKGCSCRFCKIGRNKKDRTRIEKAFRQKSKMALKKGDSTIYLNGVGYTD